MKHAGDLLDMIHEKTGCEYMSDMKGAACRSRVFRAVSEINIEAFRLEQWSEAISYLWGEEVAFSSHEDVRTYFQKKSDTLN